MLQTFIEGLAEKLFIDNIILIANAEEDKLNNAMELLKKISDKSKRIQTVLTTQCLEKISNSLNGKPSMYVVIGKNAGSMMEQVFVHCQISSLVHSLIQISHSINFVQSQFWIIEAESTDELKTDMATVDIPIDSNVLVFTGNKTEKLDIFDVYRPTADSNIM